MENNDFTQLRLEIASAIKAARLQIGVSQEALALAAEVDRTYVSQLERGVANPSLLILYRIAEALGCQLQVGFKPHSPATGD